MAPATLEGQTLGKYRILEPLGRGGMAQVYRAYHPQLDRYLAVKVLRSDLVEEEEFLARFQREARAVAALRHPNIVQVYDFDVEDDCYYMVMELLEGDTLKAYLNSYRTRGEQIPLKETLRILADVLDGLAYAHSEGIVHRDIKPANILLSRRCQAVITDFGVAQIVGGTRYTISGALMGTLNYMAPEQGLQGHGDARSDIYSLGIVIYEMLTGRPPYDADTPLAILMKHLNDPLPLLHKLDPTIPDSIERVVLKALAKSPEDRYQSATEMHQALCEAAASAGIEMPAQISLPPAPAAVTPRESLAVFSGADRQQLLNTEFAAGDTDAALAERLEAERREIDRLGVDPQEPSPPVTSAEEIQKSPLQKVIQAALIGAGVLVGVNFLALSFSTSTGRWDIFTLGWPMEIFLVSLLLGLVMVALPLPWMLLLTGIVFGQGVILTYFALTANWGHWLYLWPLEVLLVFGLVTATLWLYKHPARSPLLIRRWGTTLVLLSAGLAFLVMVLSLLWVPVMRFL